jgi:homoserine O-acetyltransferase/O-succinyltransferase
MLPKTAFLCAIALSAAVLLPAGIGIAHTPEQAAHQRFEEGNLKLESGETIKDFVISYVTHGKLNEKKNNAILMTSSIAGNHHRIDFLIGPGKALDTDKYFIIATDAIGNGLSTSPSNSKSQPGTKFPHFTIRDMIESQYRLVKEKFGIARLLAVSGASMGGMQTLQWGVSHPEMMEALIALTPMAKTPAWSIAVNEATRKALTADAAYNNGDYAQQPEKGWRAWVDVLLTLATRTPDGLKAEFPKGLDVLGWIKGFEENWVKGGFDANNWIWQSWAYDRHDVGTTPGFAGDTVKALGAIKAKAILMNAPDDLYNPTSEAAEDAKHIGGAEYILIPSLQGHFGASSAKPADVEFMNKTINGFLNRVTDGGKKLQ